MADRRGAQAHGRTRGHIQVPVDDLDALLREMSEHIRLTRAEPGCLAFEIRRSGDDDCRFDVYEVFESQDAFDQHQIRTRHSRWAAVTVNVARHYDITTGG